MNNNNNNQPTYEFERRRTRTFDLIRKYVAETTEKREHETMEHLWRNIH